MAQIIDFPHTKKRRHTILVVANEPATQDMLCNALYQSDFNALAVSSADEAARMLDRGIVAIDLVFSDADVAGILDGHALARWVVDNKPGLPFLLASDHIDSEWAEVLLKPYDLPLAIRRIRTILARLAKRRA